LIQNNISNLVTTDVDRLIQRYLRVRRQSERICEPLEFEDYVVQPIVDVSPPKWHLGHTTWFFETFVLEKFYKGYTLFDPDFNFMFNSYYNAVGNRVLRANRGNMTRPSVKEVYDYRKFVDEQFIKYINTGDIDSPAIEVIEVGLQHEQQHQELLVSDIKYIFGNNPLFPVYRPLSQDPSGLDPEPNNFMEVEEGKYPIGFEGSGFCFDNEKGDHQVFLHQFRIADRLITNAEYLQFMSEGGYSDFRHWLSDGWTWVSENQIKAPLYWFEKEDGWYHYTLGGFQNVPPEIPVTHISYYEADAFAHWAGKG